MVRPLGGSFFFEYHLLVLAKVIKPSCLTPILAYMFLMACFSLSVMYNCKVLYRINKALQQKFTGCTF